MPNPVDLLLRQWAREIDWLDYQEDEASRERDQARLEQCYADRAALQRRRDQLTLARLRELERESEDHGSA